MSTLKIKCPALIRNCPKTDSLATFFFKSASKTFNFQGCHIYYNLANLKLNVNPENKSYA